MCLNFFRACRSTLVGLRWVLWSTLFGIAKSFPKWWTTLIHTCTNTVEKFLLLHVYQHFIATDLNFSHSGGLIKRAHVALIYISLLDREVSAHIIYWLDFHFHKIPFMSSVHFSVWPCSLPPLYALGEFCICSHTPPGVAYMVIQSFTVLCGSTVFLRPI